MAKKLWLKMIFKNIFWQRLSFREDCGRFLNTAQVHSSPGSNRQSHLKVLTSVRFVRCIHNFEYSLRVHRVNSPISETDLPRRHKSPLEPIRRSSYGESHLIGQQDPEGLHRSRRLRWREHVADSLGRVAGYRRRRRPG